MKPTTSTVAASARRIPNPLTSVQAELILRSASRLAAALEPHTDAAHHLVTGQVGALNGIIVRDDGRREVGVAILDLRIGAFADRRLEPTGESYAALVPMSG